VQDNDGDKQADRFVRSDRGMVQAPDQIPLNITPESPPEKRLALSRLGRPAPEKGHNEALATEAIVNRVVPRPVLFAPDANSVRGFFMQDMKL